MDVFVAGATGVLGQRLVRELTNRDHEVVGLTRDEDDDTLVADQGAEPRRGDVLNRDSLVAAADECDVVIHAATAIPTGRSPSTEDWERNDRVRREGARNLTAAAVAVGAKRYLQQSVVWVARQPDGSQFDERADTHPDQTTQSALDAERVAMDAADGLDVAILRCGWFYAPEAAHTRTFGRDLLKRDLPIVGPGLFGRGDAVLSYLHVEDAARAFAVATERDATGLWHVVDDEPAPLAMFLSEFADLLDAPDPRRVPAWLARLFVGKDTVRLLSSSMPTKNERFRKAFDWEPRFPTYRDGLVDVVEAWKENGMLRNTGVGYEWIDG